MQIRSIRRSRLGLCVVLALSGKALAQGVAGGPCVESLSPDGDPSVYRTMEEFPCIDAGDWSSSPRTSAQFWMAGVLPEADSHSSAKFLPDGSRVVVANRDSANLCIFNPTTRALDAAIALSGRPESVAISPNGTRAVTANTRENTASIVDLVSKTEIAVIPVGTSPTTALINSAGTLAVISNSGSQDASVIDLATGAVVRTFPTGGVFSQVSVNPETAAYAFRAYGPALAGNILIFPDSTADKIKLIDITDGSTTVLTSALDPIGVAVTPDGTKAVVTHYFTPRTLTVIDVTTKSITAAYAMTTDLWGPVSINPAGTKACVAVQNACRIVDLATGAASADISTASVNELYTSADGQYAVCVGFRGSLVSYATSALVKDLNNFVSTSVGAVSPAAPLAVQFSDTFGEDMVVMSTNGAGGSLLSAGPSGPAPEADRARTAAVTPDGLKTVVVSQQSQTATIINTYTGVVTATVNLDRRPGEVRITPNGSKAVVTSRDGTNLSIITLATGAKTDVAISTRADQLEISPDSQYAYAAVVTSDGVWRVNLNTGAVAGAKLVTGDMGSVGYMFQQFSGMRLSPDGATLVTCNSFGNTISIINTATWSVVKTLAVPGFPAEVSFSADSTKMYVSQRDTDSVAVVSNAGAASAITATIPVGDGPYLTVPTPSGSKLYVVNWYANTIGVVNLATNSQVKTLAMPAGESVDGLRMSVDGSTVYVTHGQASISFGGGGFSTSQTGALESISTATDTVVSSLPTLYCGAGLTLSANGHIGVIPQPWGDGVTVIDFVDCPADFDHSGFADTDDFDAFVHAYEEGIIEADADGSGFVDTDDFDAYVHFYEAGC